MVEKGLLPKAAAASYKMVRFDLFGTPGRHASPAHAGRYGTGGRLDDVARDA